MRIWTAWCLQAKSPICPQVGYVGQTARDFVVTKTGMNGSMNIQESEEFKTSKFYCKTDFDMTEIKKEESEYVPLPKFYKFKSKEERERILYKTSFRLGRT